MSPQYDSVFVLYPRGVRTGGPEALHQLVDTLRSLGQPAFLVPCSGEGRERVKDYECYDAPEARVAIDSPTTAIVAPETHIKLLSQFKNAKKFCWWLSIDNSPLFSSARLLTRIDRENLRNRLRIVKHALLNAIQYAKRRQQCSGIVHLAQSSYAWSFLASHLSLTPSLLSDYTLQAEFDPTARMLTHRGRTIAYNPAKGLEDVEKIIQASPLDIEWRPIKGMSRTEVVSLLQSTGIYLDMGHHPGKDRLPREAALAGALTIVSRQGAGAYYNDVPIPWEHKISIDHETIQEVAAKMDGLLGNLAMESAKQSAYVAQILTERAQFQDEVSDIFLKGRLGLDRADYVGELGQIKQD